MLLNLKWYLQTMWNFQKSCVNTKLLTLDLWKFHIMSISNEFILFEFSDHYFNHCLGWFVQLCCFYNSKPRKLLDQFIYLVSNISSIESDVKNGFKKLHGFLYNLQISEWRRNDGFMPSLKVSARREMLSATFIIKLCSPITFYTMITVPPNAVPFI